MASIPPEHIRLVKRAKRGDAGSLRKLYSLYMGAVYNLARQTLYDSSQAEDVTQEVAIKVFNSIKNIREPGAFKTWLYRITALTCYDYNRKEGDEQRERFSIDETHDNETERLVEMDKRVLPDESLEENETHEYVMEIINSLPHAQRLAIYLRYYEELSYEEIAHVLGIKVTTVGTNIMKGKKGIKEKLETMNYDWDSGSNWPNANGATQGAASNAVPVALPSSAQRTDLPTPNAQNPNDYVYGSGGAMAIAPLIAKSFAADNSNALASSSFLRTRLSVEQTISSLPVATKTTAGIVKTVLATTGLVATSGAIIYGAYAFAKNLDPVSTPIIHQTVQPDVFDPDAQITFANNGNQNPSINPVGATISTSSGEAGMWSIVRTDNGATVSTGTGDPNASDFSTLEKGNYELQWQISDSAGTIATAINAFSVR
jgi:RNA polymerase sigma-70 factor (ECF subfamily)